MRNCFQVIFGGTPTIHISVSYCAVILEFISQYSFRSEFWFCCRRLGQNWTSQRQQNRREYLTHCVSATLHRTDLAAIILYVSCSGMLIQRFTHPLRAAHFLEDILERSGYKLTSSNHLGVILESSGYKLTSSNQLDYYGQDKVWNNSEAAIA